MSAESTEQCYCDETSNDIGFVPCAVCIKRHKQYSKSFILVVKGARWYAVNSAIDRGFCPTVIKTDNQETWLSIKSFDYEETLSILSSWLSEDHAHQGRRQPGSLLFYNQATETPVDSSKAIFPVSIKPKAG